MDLTDQQYDRIKEYVMEALKRRVINEAKINDETVQDIINELKGHIKAMPFTDPTPGTFPLKKYKGNLQTYGLMGDDISAVDRAELDYESETLRRKTVNPTTFVAASGSCDLHFVEDGRNVIHKLSPGDPKWLDVKTSFALSSNGSGCRVILVMERS